MLQRIKFLSFLAGDRYCNILIKADLILRELYDIAYEYFPTAIHPLRVVILWQVCLVATAEREGELRCHVKYWHVTLQCLAHWMREIVEQSADAAGFGPGVRGPYRFCKFLLL